MYNSSRKYYNDAVKAMKPKKPPRKKKENELFEINKKSNNKNMAKNKKSNYSTKGEKKKK
mgnify:CR=1 FL=1|tara:strand:- start:367 stop:546 length:180 start_codon:yes stop_codon:yes gene_type:complete